jgi:hypothetical protein
LFHIVFYRTLLTHIKNSRSYLPILRRAFQTARFFDMNFKSWFLLERISLALSTLFFLNVLIALVYYMCSSAFFLAFAALKSSYFINYLYWSHSVNTVLIASLLIIYLYWVTNDLNAHLTAVIWYFYQCLIVFLNIFSFWVVVCHIFFQCLNLLCVFLS